MGVSHGGDPQRMREVGARLRISGGHIDQISEHGHAQLSLLTANWSGHDLASFAAEWPHVRDALTRAAEQCRAMAEELHRNAEEQDGASTGQSGAGGRADLLAAPAAPLGQGADLLGQETRHRPPNLDQPAINSVPIEVQEKWGTYTEDQKIAIIQQMVDEQAAEYGIDPPPIVTMKSWGENGDWGEHVPPNVFNRGRGRIHLNDYHLDNPEMLVAAPHEMRHAMQVEAMDDAHVSFWEDLWGEEEHYDEGVTSADVEAWEEPYIDPEVDPEGYFDHPAEVDAETEGRDRASELTPDELDRLLEASEG